MIVPYVIPGFMLAKKIHEVYSKNPNIDCLILMNHGIFTFSPLQPGYGLTIGNAVRRVLLSSLEGYAVTGIKIPGIQHEFSTIDGIVEDVSEIILNLKNIRFKPTVESPEKKFSISFNKF